MAFRVLTVFSGVTVEADFTATDVRALRVTNTTGAYVVCVIKDAIGAVGRREEFLPNSTRTFNIPTALRAFFLTKTVDDEGVQRQVLSLPPGWRGTFKQPSIGRPASDV